jgi:S1-C subfamily serine protease
VENRAQLAPSPELPENVITPDRPITTRDGETIPTLSDTAGLDSIFPSSNFGMDLTSSREGLVMGTVDPNSLAAQSGFLKGDVITAANDTMLSTQESLINVFNQHAAGDKITFKVVREGIPRRLTMTLPQAFVAETPPGGPESRTTLRPVLPTASAIDPEKLRPVNLGWAYRDTPEGLVIEDVSEGGFAATAGLQQGDLIETVDAVPVTSPVELIRELHRHSAGTLVPITVRRAGEPVNVNVQLPEESRTPLATDPSAPSAEVNDLQTLIQEVRALRTEVEALKQAQTPPPAN